MSLNEKIGQLVQLASDFYSDTNGAITGPMAEMGVTDELVTNSGSVLGATGTRNVKKIIDSQLKNNRLHIPLLVMADVIHGYKTIFPIPLAIGCTWNPGLAEKTAEIAAHEAAVSGIHVVFAPMVDLVRDPRWGRVMESTGEDPYLNSVFAAAFVHGFQGDNLKDDLNRTAACVKHFAGYGAVEGGREYNTVDLSELRMRQEYLPAYQAAVDAGCKVVMTSFNTVDGIPSSANQWLLRKVLREEWNFDGTVISDWGAVRELIPHGVAENEKEAARKALIAGVDIEMMTLCYPNTLCQLIESGEIKESTLDQAVWNVLKLKNDLGLFENPYRGADEAQEQKFVYCHAHREWARRAAEESCVLLKNNGILPINSSKKLALIGPFADHGDLLGAWSWQGDPKRTETLTEVFSAEGINVLTAKGCEIAESKSKLLREAIQKAEESELILLALGESSEMSGEAASRTKITLPECQLELLRLLKPLNKPIVIILFNGRPLELSEVIDDADAVLEAWYPGSEGARAIVRLLTGKVNPSGKLTMSFPQSVGQIPVYYNANNTGRPESENKDEKKYVSKYIDCANDARFPFGFGLSYTSFEINNLRMSKKSITVNEEIRVSIDVKNTGDAAGAEVVQLYIRDIAGDVVRPLKELKSFRKIYLQPGEQQTVAFQITERMLRYWHPDLRFKSDTGTFNLMIGQDSAHTLNDSFYFRATGGMDA
nr:glycoside hydrolase family 3 N-terminal domain-containing protein [Sporolactobacillus kofuensis]